MPRFLTKRQPSGSKPVIKHDGLWLTVEQYAEAIQAQSVLVAWDIIVQDAWDYWDHARDLYSAIPGSQQKQRNNALLHACIAEKMYNECQQFADDAVRAFNPETDIRVRPPNPPQEPIVHPPWDYRSKEYGEAKEKKKKLQARRSELAWRPKTKLIPWNKR